MVDFRFLTFSNHRFYLLSAGPILGVHLKGRPEMADGLVDFYSTRNK